MCCPIIATKEMCECSEWVPLHEFSSSYAYDNPKEEPTRGSGNEQIIVGNQFKAITMRLQDCSADFL